VLLAGLVMASLGLWLAGTLTAELTTAVTNALFLVLLLLGGVAVAPDVLPAGLAAVGAASPLGAAVEGPAQLLDGVQATSGRGGRSSRSWRGVRSGRSPRARTFRWEP
jgi:ABC-2 type transport system permease protein